MSPNAFPPGFVTHIHNSVVIFTGSVADAAIIFAAASIIAWFVIVLAKFGGSRIREERARQLAMWTSLLGMVWLGSIRHAFLPSIRNPEKVTDSLASIV